jgi:hypothetical protein
MGKRGPQPGLKRNRQAQNPPSIDLPAADMPPAEQLDMTALDPEPEMSVAGNDVVEPVEMAQLSPVAELDDAADMPVDPRAPLDLARYLSADEFHERMLVIYRVAGQSPPVVMKLITGTPRPPLQSLIHAGEITGCREAHDALYQTICEVDWLHWLVERQAGLWARLAIIAAFGFALGSSVYEEIRTTWHDAPEPVTDQAPPPPEPSQPAPPPPPPPTGFVPERHAA